jgi:putative endopeptidase
MTPPTVNAYFDPQMNDSNFPAGVLQPPLYDPKMDDAPNYGNTGGTIGHGLTHDFDDQGRNFDATGNLKDWWTKDDAKAFVDRAQCIVDQYSQYTIVDDISIKGKLTNGEDIADLGGVVLAWDGLEVANRGQGPRAARRLLARPALLPRLRAVGVRERSAGEPAREGADRSALSGHVSCQRAGGKHAGVRARFLVQGRLAYGRCESLPCLVVSR